MSATPPSSSPLSVSTYDRIGGGYNRRRRADPRIARALLEELALAPGAALLDVGAGTGNYTAVFADAGFRTAALEPSATMLAARDPRPDIAWTQGRAEAPPYANASFDAVVCTLAMHHFADQARALREITRVLRPGGRFVAFTSDPRRMPADFWMRGYFADLFAEAETVFPPEAELDERLRAAGLHAVRRRPFPLPHDLADGFFCSAWRRPEEYLQAEFRAGISSFRLMSPEREAAAIARLREDLATGAWDARHGATRTLECYDAGYLFATASKPTAGV